MYSRAKRVQWLHFLQGGQSNLLEMVKICRGVDGNLRVCAIKCTHTHTHTDTDTQTHTQVQTNIHTRSLTPTLTHRDSDLDLD